VDKNILYYGDNLEILREHVADESVDLIYLDPPFNSKQDYNVLFSEQNGTRSAAQYRAFEDTWVWNDEVALAFENEITRGGPVADALAAFRSLLKTSDMMAYLTMMAPRLGELMRALKQSGSIYLHCDTVASHYLKVLMDTIFGPANFVNEIIWKRTSGHSDAKRFGRVHDCILLYSKSKKRKWNTIYVDYEKDYVDRYYRYTDDDGRRFMSDNLSAAGLQGGGYEYEWKGVKRVWRCPISTMKKHDSENRIFYTRNGIPRLKRYLDEAKGMPSPDIWSDVEALRSWHKENLEYPTQKPLELLERIINASSDEGDTVLDPFCGCGTTVVKAHELKRKWIGIDITHIAISLIKHRLSHMFGASEKDSYEIIGEPVSVGAAAQLAKDSPYQFQWWAIGKVHAYADEKKGADKGIDGTKYFFDDASGKPKKIIISVKSGKVGVTHIRDLRGVVVREKAQLGVYLTLKPPTKPMKKEAASAGFYTHEYSGKKYPKIQILTIKELLEGKEIKYPKIHGADATFKAAPKPKKKDKQMIDKNLLPPEE